MAAIDFFVGTGVAREVVGGETNNQSMTSGTASSATSYIELRMRTQDGSSVATGLTKLDVIKFMEVVKRWLIEGGLISNGTNVPII